MTPGTATCRGGLSLLPIASGVSEIMLQQTRVEAVRGYFSRWMNALPDIPALAAADEAVYTKLWEGLGYYSRVRNLHRAAVLLCEQYGGELPADYDRLLALPGVGEYRQALVCVPIAFDCPCPAVDGNVLRVAATNSLTISRRSRTQNSKGRRRHGSPHSCRPTVPATSTSR